jgi:hypothetical protein
MNQIKGRTNFASEEPIQPEVSNELMKDEFFCIFRERDLLRNQIHSPFVESTLGIVGRVKRKIRDWFIRFLRTSLFI